MPETATPPLRSDDTTGTPTPAVLLLSGGLDSVTVLAHAVREGFAVHALSFRYGQRHSHEVELAGRAASRYGAVEHRIAEIDLGAFGGSALTSALEVPRDRGEEEMQAAAVPITYVPARNTIFLAHALAWAEVLGSFSIFIGVNSVDYSGYPDCRPEFIEAFERMANLATAAAVEGGGHIRIHAPLLRSSKAQIVRLGLSLGVDYGQTSSCYDPDERHRACGRCDACRLRLRGFADAGALDPAPYSPYAPPHAGRASPGQDS